MIDSINRYTEPTASQDDVTKPANCCRCCEYIGSNNKKIFESICKISDSLEDSSIIVQLNTFCNCMAQCLYDNNYYDDLPELISHNDDGDLFLEWIFRNFRFGFLFCTNPSDSGWIITVNSPEGIVSGSTKFNDDIPASVTTIVDSMMRLA